MIRINCTNNNRELIEAFLWNAYLDVEPYTCAWCGRKFPAQPDTGVSMTGPADDMHYNYHITAENIDGNSVNYDVFDLPKEDTDGCNFKVILAKKSDDEGQEWKNMCKHCWPKYKNMDLDTVYYDLAKYN